MSLKELSHWIRIDLKENNHSSFEDLISAALADLMSAAEEGKQYISKENGTLKHCSYELDNSSLDMWFHYTREATDKELADSRKQAERSEALALLSLQDILKIYPHLKDKI